MDVAVTGASGHIGANLVRELLARGDRVRALVRRHTRALDGLDVERVEGDVRDPESLRRAFDGAEVAYHVAGIISLDGGHGGLVEAVNVGGTENVARAALACGVRRLVHTSSVHAFAMEPVDRPVDESRPPSSTEAHATAYDRSKAAGEVRVRRAVDDGLDAVVLNPTAVVGPYDFGPSRTGRMFLDLYHRRLPSLVQGAFDWVDARDVAAAAIAAAERGRTGASYLVGGHYRTLEELAGLAAEVTGVAVPRFVSPMWLARVGAPFATLWGRLRGKEPLFSSESLRAVRLCPRIDDARAKRELGHVARPLADTVRDVYAWFERAGLLAT